MPRPRSTFSRRARRPRRGAGAVGVAVAVAASLATLAIAPRARAQACCAGATALTPARLALHEDALVGLQARIGVAYGAFNSSAMYASSPRGTAEIALEQDLLGAVRFLRRGQVALLVPVVETFRRVPGASESGGGFGDANVGLRYDFTLAGVSNVPGIAVLAGVTFPTGRPPESSTRPLATDATGVGAFQGNVGLAVEQSFGAWLVSASAIAAQRAPRSVRGIDTTLGTQLTCTLGASYSFPSDAALAAFVSASVESRAVVNDVTIPGSSRLATLLGVAGLYPFSDSWRAQASLSAHPPLSAFGRNQPAAVTLSLVMVRTWS